MSVEQTLPTPPRFGAEPHEPQVATSQRLMFDQLVISRDQPPREGLARLLPASFVIHAALGVAALVVPLLADEALPEAQQAVHAFFVTSPPIAAPPPPPPPPPAPRATQVARSVTRPEPTTNAFVAPVEVPDVIEADAGLDLGIDGGVAGGVAGGVPGGVIGGVVGGLPEAPPPAQAIRVGGDIAPPKKVKNVAPVYPEMARQARVEGIVILECEISPMGRVTNVKVLRGMPLLDQAAIDAVKQWVYTPTLVGGVPVPVLMTATVQFNLKR